MHIHGQLHNMMISIDSFAIRPNLSVTARQRSNVSHIDHGLTKAIKEVALAISKAVHNGNSVSAS